jgi:hypothetical protein
MTLNLTIGLFLGTDDENRTNANEGNPKPNKRFLLTKKISDEEGNACKDE